MFFLWYSEFQWFVFSILIPQYFFLLYICIYEVLGKFSLNLGIVSDELKLHFSVTQQLIKETLACVLLESGRKTSLSSKRPCLLSLVLSLSYTY